jgi:hypothetical protein
MAAELLSFFRPAMSVNGDWSSQEVAEFYRVEAALVQAGVSVSVDRGVSDEGDPWFVFCRSTDGEVIVHFARINGNYLIVADSIGRPFRGPDFRKVLGDFVAVNPTLIPIPTSRSAKLMLHPASLLAAIVATALYHMSGTEAVASTLDPAAVGGTHASGHATASFETLGETSVDPNRKWSDWQVAAVVSAMVALAATEYSDSGKAIFSDLASTILDTSNDHIVLSHSVVADASPIPDLDGKSWTAGHLDSPDAHFLFDDFILSGGGQAVNQQFQIGSNEGQKSFTPPTVSAQDSSGGEHWWTPFLHGSESDPRYTGSSDASTSVSSDTAPKGADQLALVFTAPSAQGAPTLASMVDSSHSNLAAGSSSPDHPIAVSESFTDQTAVVFVNNELNSANKTVSQVSLTGSLSVQDVISHGASDVFGSALPPTLSLAAGHDGGQVIPTTDSQTTVTGNAPVVSTPSVSQQGTIYEPFNAAASQTLDAFVRQNNFEVLTSNNNVVLFDTNAADFSSPDLVTKTWSMSDGSTITVVGILPHAAVA